MRFAAAIVVPSLLFIPAGSLAQETVPAAVEAPRPLADGADPLFCSGIDSNICVVAISGAAVAGVIAANALTGGALSPVLLAGNGGLSAAVVGLLVAHVGLDIALIGSGSAAAIVTGVADPVVTAAGDAYTTAKSYVAAAADSFSTAASGAGTAVGDWLNGR